MSSLPGDYYFFTIVLSLVGSKVGEGFRLLSGDLDLSGALFSNYSLIFSSAEKSIANIFEKIMACYITITKAANFYK